MVPPGGSSSSGSCGNQFVPPVASTSSQEQERNESCICTSPNQKQSLKNPSETCAATPRRSATKRKTKPTPLKLMTPLKHKTGSDSSDSAEVLFNHKLLYGTLLDNRELHERIAENINQFIRPSGVEEGLEQREESAAEAASDVLASTCTDGKGQPVKDLSTQEELEKVIKTVVDKTESDPLFESLLCDILGPDCDDENIADSLIEGKSTQGEKPSGESEPIDARPSEDGKKDPIAILEDQNEAAIKSILEAQPMMKDTPNPKQGKTAPTPPPPPQQRLHPIPIAPRETMNIIPGNPPFILKKINSEDIKNLNLNSSSSLGMIADSQNSFSNSAAETSVNVVTVQEGVQYTEQMVSAVHTVDLTSHVDALQPLICSDSNVNIDVQVSGISLCADNASTNADLLAIESQSEVDETGSSRVRGMTPDVVIARPTRAATEGQRKNVEKEEDTPMMPAGKHRASMSTPRRKSRGHIRALDFGSTPPKKPSSGRDSSVKVLTTSTPYDAPGKFGRIGSLRASLMAQKELPKCLVGVPRSGPLPDLSTTCIATRSPPPRLSGAWNKVGVDLIFGCDTPNDETVSLLSQASRNSSLEVSKVLPDGVNSSSKWESPKRKAKGAWDAALRAQLGDTAGTPTMTRVQIRTILRMERQKKKKLEMQVAAEETNKKGIEETSASKTVKGKNKTRNKIECGGETDGKPSAKGKRGKKGSQGAAKKENQNLTVTDETPQEVTGGKRSREEEDEEGSSLGKNKVNASNEDDRASDQLTIGEKRKRNSRGEVPIKKKMASEPRPPVHELDTTNQENATSPEKTWVVQQSPGSWANKRSLHSTIPGQNLDLEGNKFLSGTCAARRCLDLHETPRKPDVCDISERATQSGVLSNKNSTLWDHTALTVVDTPLFPPTPGICGIGTPPSQDSREAVETFPNYFKPREKDCTEGKEKQVEVRSGENVENGATVLDSQAASSVSLNEKESSVITEDSEKSDNITDEMVGNKRNSFEGSGKAKSAAPRVKKNAKSRKPPVKKIPAARAKSQEKQEKGKPKVAVEEEVVENAEKDDEGDEDVLPTRVLRPRRKTSYFQDASLSGEDRKSDSNEKEVKGSGKKKSAPKRKKKQPSPEPEPCNIVLEEEIVEGLVYNALAPEVVKTQSHEAEELAREIQLKLSPLIQKTSDFEEEEDEGDSAVNAGNPAEKCHNVEQQVGVDSVPENHLEKEMDSSASSRSSSSESSSSDSSSEGEADPDEMSPAKDQAGSSRETVEKMDESHENGDLKAVGKVMESEITGNASCIKKPGDKTPLSSTTSKDEAVEKRLDDGKNSGVAQCKKGDDNVAANPGGRSESEKLVQNQKVKVLEKNDLNKSALFLSEQKKRRDNLEKILFGREYNDMEEETVALETQSSLLPLTDHSLSTELELKKLRTLERLRGGKAPQSSVTSERTELNSSQSPSPNAKTTTVSSSPVLSIVSPRKNMGNPVTQKSPRKSTPVKETAKVLSIFDGGEDDDYPDDCPELRLSEGEDFDFVSPEKLLISPGKFELLASLEDKLAVLHGDITSPTIKKTARMSCTSAVPQSVEGTPKKELLKQLCGDVNITDSIPDISSRKAGKEYLPAQEPEAIPSTSKAAESRHKAEERKYLSSLKSLTNANTSGVTLRKRNSEKNRRALRSNQLESGNEDRSIHDESAPLVENRVIPNEKNCEKIVEGKDKDKCYRGSPKKSKEQKSSNNLAGQQIPANESRPQLCQVSERGMSEGGKKIGDVLESQAEAVSAKSCVDGSTDKDSGASIPNSVLGAMKQSKKQPKKCVEVGAKEVEKSKDKVTRSRKKSGHVQESSSKDKKNLVVDLNEDELTRDGFTADESSERRGNQPDINIPVASQKIPEASKKSVPGEKLIEHRIGNVDHVAQCGEQKDATEGILPQKSNNCDNPIRELSSGKNVDVKKKSSLSPETATEHENLSSLDSEQVREELSEDEKRRLNCNPQGTSKKSSKIISKPAQIKPSDSGKGEKQASLKPPSAEVCTSSDAPKLTSKSSEKSLCDQVHASDGQESGKNVQDSTLSTHRTLVSKTTESSSGAGDVCASIAGLSVPVPACSPAQVEEGANNVSWPGSTDMSFSSNEAYITIVYDEDNPPASTSSVLNSQLGPPLSPSAPELEGLTVELDGEIVTITKSDYIELFSYTPKDTTVQISGGVRGKVISTILSAGKKSKSDNNQQKVVGKKKKDDDLEHKHGSKGGSLIGDRKRKHADASECDKGEMAKPLRPSRRKEVPKKISHGADSFTDKEMASIQKVVDACNDISNDENTIDDDSLMTYAAVGSISSEDARNKEDGGSKKFLPLKKRRTTTEGTPVKSQADGDVVNNNPGMFFPLNVMEIEDFLSKVHGDGS
ncbi:microtubule-associated protein futsch-like [Hetaerina americana]|uniref:microtubule-associated protein futsch-like n=1 Tax=Hetaerina americana TaxID=62018 RepID=UPI003A7F5E03